MADLPALELEPLPEIDLRHLFVLSDDTGILQHATRATPDLHHGYCTDDNARSLIAAVKVLALPATSWTSDHNDLPGPNDVLKVTQRYLAFLAYAFNEGEGRFRNFMQYDRSWLEEVGSEDSHARTMWGLGTAVRFAPNKDVEDLAESLLLRALPAVDHFQYIKPASYALLGLNEYLHHTPGQELARRHLQTLTESLYERYNDHATTDWPWWEDELNWGNAKPPHALIVGGSALGREAIVQAGLDALRWCLDVQTGDRGQLSIVGNRGWFKRGDDKPAQYDQQPIEAKALMQACLAAAVVTGDSFWTAQAKRCFEWFIGHNDAGKCLYNADTGGGHDGLEPTGMNANQGAESTLAYLMSVLELHHYNLARDGEAEQIAHAPCAG